MPVYDPTQGQAISFATPTPPSAQATPDYSIDTSGTPQDVQRRQMLAAALMKQGTDTSPAAGGKFGGIATIANRGMAAALGSYQANQATQEEQQGRAAHRQMIAAALQSPDGKISPQAMIGLASDPWGTAVENSAVTHVADMQQQQARDAIADKHWAASYSLQQHADARADEAAKRADMTADQQAAERAVAAEHYGLKAGTPEYQDFTLTGRLPDPNKNIPNSVAEYGFYLNHFQPSAEEPTPMKYETFSTAKARAGATTIANNFDPNGAQTYDHVMTEGVAKSHAALANGVEDAQSRARDLAAMQGQLMPSKKAVVRRAAWGRRNFKNSKKRPTRRRPLSGLRRRSMRRTFRTRSSCRSSIVRLPALRPRALSVRE